MAEKVRLTIDPEQAQLEYDRPSEFTVTVQNLTGQVDAFDLSVVGLSPQYVRFDPPRLSKFPAPERSAASKLTVTIPTRAKVPARSHVIGVKAQSAVDGSLARVEEVRLDFPAVENLVLEAVPRVITSGRRGRFRVRAMNRGSVPKQIQLVGTDSEEAVAYVFDPPALLVPPFGEVETTARVKARRPLSGGNVQRALTVRSVDSVGQIEEAHATFVQRPLLRKPILRLGALGVLGAAAAAAFLLTRPQPITLDDYAQQPRAEAEVHLDSLGLEVTVTQEISDFVEAGLVLKTTPRAGSQVDPGSMVVVVVSSGPEVMAVPDLTNLTSDGVAERVDQLASAGFNVTKTSQPSKDVPIGQAIRTSPPAGDEVARGESIEVFISTGVEVPRVVGSNLADALAALAEQGLTDVEPITQPTDDEARNGEVVAQNPANGERVNSDRRIVLTVLEFVAPEPTEPPTTTGG